MESLDFKKLRIIDVQSILEGIGIDGKIAPERIEQFRAMLGDPKLAMAAFREFLDSSGFQDALNPFVSAKFSDEMSKTLSDHKSIPAEAIDGLTNQIANTFVRKFWGTGLASYASRVEFLGGNIKEYAIRDISDLLKSFGCESLAPTLYDFLNSKLVSPFNLRKEKIEEDIKKVLRKGSFSESLIDSLPSKIFTYFTQYILHNPAIILGDLHLKTYNDNLRKNVMAFLQPCGGLADEIFSCFFQQKKIIIGTVSMHIHEYMSKHTEIQ